jgi:LuxR family maltose regulon positive regulatory protein
MPMNPSTVLEPPLLRTKISIPQIPASFIHRPRLTGQIQRGVQGPLTLLAAPAGFGKTQLLVDWTHTAPLPVAWLTLDSEDNDPSRFFRYLIGAFQTLQPGLGAEALEFIQFSGGSSLEVGLTLLINDLSALSKDIALVLDDCQVLENLAVLQGLSLLLKYLPPTLHLLIASRNEPELDLAFLRAKGRLVELDADVLRFRREEIEQYFQEMMGWQLSPEAVQAVEERTAGWVTSLQLLALSLRNQADPASLLAHLHGQSHYLSDFLAQEVLDRQPEEVRQFLLRSSILERLTGPLCEAVVDPDAGSWSGAGMLKRLEEAGLFLVALDEQHEWFRYHPLFADFLQHALAGRQPGEIPELHKRAAVWFEANGQLDEAFQQALASREMGWAADLIERNAAVMINRGDISGLARSIGKLPDQVTHQRLRLGMAYTWALIAARQLDQARYWLDDTLRSLEQHEKQTGGAPTFEQVGNVNLAEIRGGLAVCQSILAMLKGDMEQAAQFTQQAARYLPEEDIFLRSMLSLDETLSFVFSGDTQKAIESSQATLRIARRANNPFAMIIAANEVAILQMIQGQLSKAWETLQKAQYLAVGPDGKPHPLSGFFEIVMGEILLERNLLDEANDYLERGCHAIQSVWYLGSLGGMVYLARASQARGDIPGAQEIVAEAASMALSTETSEWDEALIASLAVRLAVQRNDLVTAEQWWIKGGFPDLNTPIAIGAYPYHIYEYLLLTQARFLLGRGQDTENEADLQQAAELLEPLLPAAERFRRVISQIQILILQALAQSALGEEGAAKTLLRALALGEPESFRRFFIDEGSQLAGLLLQCRSEQQESGSHLPSLTFIDSLLADIQPGEGAPYLELPIEQSPVRVMAYLEDGLPISLSAREMEVLRLIAEGKSNQEISAELYLALNTVKRHAYNIFAKLEVKKRTQAVTKARQLGLIP